MMHCLEIIIRLNSETQGTPHMLRMHPRIYALRQGIRGSRYRANTFRGSTRPCTSMQTSSLNASTTSLAKAGTIWRRCSR